MNGGRLPDPGLAAICARCNEPREAHGGPKHYGACPDQSGLRALQESDKPSVPDRMMSTGSPLMEMLRRAAEACEPTSDAPAMFVRLHTNPAAVLAPDGSDDRYHYASVTQGRFTPTGDPWYQPSPVRVQVTYNSTTGVVTFPPMALTPWDASLSAALYGNVYLPAPRPRPSRVSRMHRSYSARLRARRRRRRD